MARHLMRVLVTRPIEDAKRTASRLSAMGHVPLLSPMLEIHYRQGPELCFAKVQAIVATSANGVRALIRRTVKRDLPVFAVGEQTASAARAAGFADVRSAQGNALTLADAIAGWASPEDGFLFHAAGSASAGKLSELLREYGFQFRRDVLYDVEPVQSFSHEAAQAFRAGEVDAVLIYSPRSAENFSRCVREAGLTARCSGFIAACISEAAADRCSGLPLREIRVASHPSEDAILELLVR
jgi:uroporphyrinogen-III synthase